MDIEAIIKILTLKAKDLTPLAPSLKWFVFGSIIRDVSLASDVDLLIIYSEASDVGIIRQGLGEISLIYPLHLTLMLGCEELETDFVKSQGAIQFFP